MILDKNTLLSEAQSVIADDASVASTNILDLGALASTAYNSAQLKHKVGLKPIPFLIQVVEDFDVITSLQVTVQSDDNDSFSSPKNIISDTILLADLVAGKVSVIDKLPVIKERYVRLNYTIVGGPNTTGKITAGIVMAVDGNLQ
jgi:hypothetical protein